MAADIYKKKFNLNSILFFFVRINSISAMQLKDVNWGTDFLYNFLLSTASGSIPIYIIFNFNLN